MKQRVQVINSRTLSRTNPRYLFCLHLALNEVLTEVNAIESNFGERPQDNRYSLVPIQNIHERIRAKIQLIRAADRLAPLLIRNVQKLEEAIVQRKRLLRL
ncbi:hypothetical protein CLF_112606 [Clonorchis sinensis]|uniref:Uncharacterized protein n=1 Tax=Clonorchis sinensis TaxID=79923 RepID=G7YMM0_CLOSI|nr:hypothetical protein CLF_112606 [Clonorchis sinensis]